MTCIIFELMAIPVLSRLRHARVQQGILGCLLPLYLDLGCLRAIIWCSGLFEPRVLKSIFGRDTLRRVIYEYLFEQVEEVSQEFIIVVGYYLL